MSLGLPAESMPDLPTSPEDAPQRDIYHPKVRAEDRARAKALIRQARAALKLLDEDPEVRAAFAEHGFGDEKIDEGRRHLQNLIDSMEREQEAWRRYHEGEALKHQREEELLRTYAVHAHLARQALKDDPESLRQLGLDKPFPPLDPHRRNDPDETRLA